MSAVIGRVLFAVGVGVVAAIIHSYYKNRQGPQAHHYGNTGYNRRGPAVSNSDSRPLNAWRDDDDDFVDTAPVPEEKSTPEVKKRRVDDGGSLQKGCPICLESFQDLKSRQVALMTTPCGHLFCGVCLREALSISTLCPNCRKGVPSGSCRQLFL